MTNIEPVPAPADYTAYARAMCPSWCTETHDVLADSTDLSKVCHQANVGSVSVTADMDAPGHRQTVEVSLQRIDTVSGANGGPWLRVVGHAERLLPEDAEQVSLLMFRAAELARRPSTART